MILSRLLTVKLLWWEQQTWTLFSCLCLPSSISPSVLCYSLRFWTQSMIRISPRRRRSSSRGLGSRPRRSGRHQAGNIYGQYHIETRICVLQQVILCTKTVDLRFRLHWLHYSLNLIPTVNCAYYSSTMQRDISYLKPSANGSKVFFYTEHVSGLYS